MKADWQPLRDELKTWRREGLTVPVWWRDDDAVASTASLDRLLALAEGCSIPVHLAVIPALAEQSLADRVRDMQLLVPLVHGWAHRNTAPEGQKKSEFGFPHHEGSTQIAQAITRLRSLFGDRLLPVFVPPWNRFDDSYLPDLSVNGYRAVSTFLARDTPFAAPGIARINTHVDPIDWRGTRGLADPDHLIAQTVARLLARRQGREDNGEPLGLLTHHLVHTGDVWQFTESFLNEMLDGGATPDPLPLPPEAS